MRRSILETNETSRIIRIEFITITTLLSVKEIEEEVEKRDA